MMRFRTWAELPSNFLLLAVAGFALIDGLGSWLLALESQLAVLALIRLLELLYLLALTYHFRLFDGMGLATLPDRTAWKVFVLISVVCLSVVAVGYLLRPDWIAYVGTPEWLKGVSGLLMMALLAPVIEELFFRAIAYRMLRQLAGVIPAVVISALLFSMMHGEMAFPQLAGGFIFAIAYEWSRNLWIPIMLHMGANVIVWLISAGLLTGSF